MSLSVAEKCLAQAGKRDPRHHLRFTQAEAQAAQRRRRSHEQKKTAGNLRAAVEATVRSIKHPFPAGKLPVRGEFRVTSMIIGSAAITNIRRIQRYLASKEKTEKAQHGASRQPGISFSVLVKIVWATIIRLAKPSELALSW